MFVKRFIPMLLAAALLLSGCKMAPSGEETPDAEPAQAQTSPLPDATQTADPAPEQTPVGQPAGFQPTDSQPTDNQPADTQPANTQPTPTQPADTQPASNQPATQEATPAQASAPITFPADGYIAKEGVNLRSEPSAEGKIVEILGQNAVVLAVSLSDGWYRIKLGDETVYAAQTLVTLGKPPRQDNMYWGKITAETTPMHISPDGTSFSDGELKAGDTVRVLRKIDGYLHIVYNRNLQRYVAAADVARIPAGEAAQETGGMLPVPSPAP